MLFRSFVDAINEVQSLRKFAARAGVRSAAKAAANKGWPIEVTRTVLLVDDIWKGAEAVHDHMWY